MIDKDTAYNRILFCDLYRKIDEFDRHIDYCETHRRFESEHERAKELIKLNRKRNKLVREALELGRNGVKPPDFEPRSFRAGKLLSTSGEEKS